MSTMLSPASTSSENVSEKLSSGRKSRVSAEHTLNRVRENQRRHRARQKDHLASLELKLANAEKQLAEARAEIAALKAERDVENAICRYSHVTTSISSASSFNPFSAIGLSNRAMRTAECTIVQVDDIGTFEPVIQANDDLSCSSNSPISGQYNGPPPCCEDTPSTPSQDIPVDPECSTCKTRPPPDPTESTTLCAQAFILISQQNFRNLDPETIRAWLAQGLRRAQRQGEGCRVENGALLRLLDFISGV